MGHWNVQVRFESVADSPENRPPIQIKPGHYSISYQRATYQKYDRRGHESPSGYGPLFMHPTITPLLPLTISPYMRDFSILKLTLPLTFVCLNMKGMRNQGDRKCDPQPPNEA